MLARGMLKGRSLGRRISGRGLQEAHPIRDERDLASHLDYVHFNPVKHGLVEHVVDWRYSSLHRHVAKGWLPGDWAGSTADGR